MSQPSAQGIASLFRGNPAPLQQRIQQEQQAKPGLPQDLQKLMALNIVTNEKDAMAKQQALSQLAQMQGPQGKPPTVMESVQEQARQKMQAQQVQAQQKQQAMQAMMQQAGPGPVPEGTQFAQAQPTAQGIDELPVEFEMAGGGIVAFQSRGAVPDPEPASDSMGGFTSDPVREALNALRIEEKYADANQAKKIAELREKAEFLVRSDAKQAGAALAALEAEERKSRRGEAPKQAEAAYDPAQATRRSQYEGGIQQLVEPPRKKPQSPAAQQSIAMPSAESLRTPPPTSLFQESQDRLAENMRANPQVGAANKEMMYQSRVAAPDTTQRDAMIKQLQAERDRQVGPQDSFGQLMEYLGEIAATPRGLSSFGAGAAGSRAVRGLEEQRAQKRFDLGSKIIEQEQGKINESRAYAKEVFGIGEKEYDQILKTQFEAAKQISSNEMEALKIAKQEALKIMELRQNAQIENRRIDAQASSAAERMEDRRLARMQQNAQFLDKMEATWASTYAKDPVYKGLSDQRKFIEMQRSIEKDEKKLSNLDAKLDDVNTKMIERGNSLRGSGGGSSLSAPPPGAVREIKK
jgi:hypothetical protein